MFMEQLLAEVRRLAEMFSLLEALREAEAEGTAGGWNSPVGMLRIALSCGRICDLGAAIARAGYRECDREQLEQIMAQARLVLCNILAVAGDRDRAV